LQPERLPSLEPTNLLEELARRRAFIDAVVISGGEPTLFSGLITFLESVKGLGLKTKLDTNGLYPEVLAEVVDRGLLDYVAMDVKTSPLRYQELSPCPVDPGRLEQSLQILQKGRVKGEIRTTCVPGLVEEDDIHRIGEAIRGVPKWALQQFVPASTLDESFGDLTPHSEETFKALAKSATPYAAAIELRGI
jgi:pyruvate formate lyase activating enzyme